MASASRDPVAPGLTAQSDPNLAPAGLDPHPDEVAVARVVRPHPGWEWLVSADPSGGLVAWRPDQRGHDRGGWQRPVARVGQDPFASRALELDPDTGESGFAGEPVNDRTGDFLGAVGGGQQPANREQAGRLDGASVRLGGTLTTERGEAPDRQRDDEDEHEVEQFARVGDRERETRLREEQVVDEERGDGRDDRRDRTPDRPDDDHRHEVDRRGIGDLGRLFEDGDDERAERDRDDCHEGDTDG